MNILKQVIRKIFYFPSRLLVAYTTDKNDAPVLLSPKDVFPNFDAFIPVEEEVRNNSDP